MRKGLLFSELGDEVREGFAVGLERRGELNASPITEWENLGKPTLPQPYLLYNLQLYEQCRSSRYERLPDRRAQGRKDPPRRA